ncbi:MAG TPA: A24 family peptidase [Armatimonadota bacterium]|jgi:prepilin peptidase CpaA|nr:prepilin peptidase [Armatimonadota bacterium]HOM80414.1 A24 family peptidase [Armatimonadota bacterium]HOQ29846.1 A24 family peptidase [Armatimonadota bacterium]HPO71998.1 A24 family peptidase [Armatimonadota bacterium]HPT98234.1 A24 family peptidase [Armatimonadota bacterium]
MLNDLSSQVFLNALLVLGLAAAVIIDLRSRRIPNLVTAPIALLGVVANVWGSGWSGLSNSLGGLLLGMVLLMPVWLNGGTGAGDVKLMGMVGALQGPQFALWTALFGAVAGGIFALAALAWRGGTAQVLRNVGASIYRMAAAGSLGRVEPTSQSFRMSYALAIALGAAAAYWYLR